MKSSAASFTVTDDSRRRGKIKCVVWDLDNTVWDGVLLENDDVRVRPEVQHAIVALDHRGILHSIASRNDRDMAAAKLREFGLDEYFLYPQISFNDKSTSVENVARLLNIGIDAIAFVDDQPFELDEVAFRHPSVTRIDATEVPTLLDRNDFRPRFITLESRLRRDMYRSDSERSRAEEDFTGSNEEFLATLNMVFTIAEAGEQDLQRAEELTVRTNQLNSTGNTYSYEELAEFVTSPDHLLLVASLDDRYGTYGKIGLALVERGTEHWTLKLLLMSCRVMSRGVGTVLLNHVMRLAAEQGKRLQADFVRTDRNRVMYVTYRFAGFEEIGSRGDVVVLGSPLTGVQEVPGYLTVDIE